MNDWKLWRKDGTAFDVELVSTPIRENDRIEGAVILFSDISERKRLERELTQLATMDSLTGIINRRFFMERAEEEISRAVRYNHPITFFMMDIDHFKNVNDTYGHHAGDVVLKNVSQICLDSLRLNDLFGRIGGEEFAVLLPETPLEHAKIVAERIRQSIEKVRWNIDGITVSCTMSIGISQLQRNSKGLHQLMKAADDALYDAKNSGRNCIRIFQ
ncbi:MAG: GGDEF domain-containing protein [Desulfamplus sp.]|nr:GGDEF domain-containing protein [Desulfamplus sp.]